MAKINWTSEAERWLKDIHDYIALDNPEAANRTVESIYHKVQILIEFPQIGYKYDQIKNREVRILLFGHYRIALFNKTKK